MDGYVSQDWHCRIFPVRHNAECPPSLGKQYDKVCTGLQPVLSDTLDGGTARKHLMKQKGGHRMPDTDYICAWQGRETADADKKKKICQKAA